MDNQSVQISISWILLAKVVFLFVSQHTGTCSYKEEQYVLTFNRFLVPLAGEKQDSISQLAEAETKWVASLLSSCGIHGCQRANFPTNVVVAKNGIIGSIGCAVYKWLNLHTMHLLYMLMQITYVRFSSNLKNWRENLWETMSFL